MTVRELLDVIPKCTIVDILGFESAPIPVTGYAFRILKNPCTMLGANVIHVDPSGDHLKILIEARYKEV